MLRRLFIRRAYNAVRWHTARHLALKVLEQKPSDLFPKGIVFGRYGTSLQIRKNQLFQCGLKNNHPSWNHLNMCCMRI